MISSRKWKDNQLNGEKILVNYIFDKALVSTFIRNFYNSNIRRQITQFKKWTKDSKIGISLKKMYKWLVSMWKDAFFREGPNESRGKSTQERGYHGWGKVLRDERNLNQPPKWKVNFWKIGRIFETIGQGSPVPKNVLQVMKENPMESSSHVSYCHNKSWSQVIQKEWKVEYFI